MSSARSVLLVDDDEDLLQLLRIRLQRAGFLVAAANSAQAALALLAQRQSSAVISDLKMEGMDGLGLLGEIESRFPMLPVILLTAHGTIPDAIAATKQGAFAFLTKPLDHEELISCLERAIAHNVGDQATLAQGTSSAPWRASILSRSPVMETLMQQAELAAASNASIIIESESGTGKELLAGAIHAASVRADKPFVAVNCTAIPESLFESEMFGHLKGSFTGAHRDREGVFQQADGGTLFLDEIGDMPLAFQAKLLRVLQERSVRPLGSEAAIEVDVRIICATHRDLEQAIDSTEFREDLYYRLGVVLLHLPSLAERREDIPLLANHFLEQFGADGIASGFSDTAMERMVAAQWPGNVRQLANVVQQCVVLCRSEIIPHSLVDRALRSKTQGLIPFAEARDRFEFDYLSSLLHATAGNVTQAARLAQRNRSEFYKLLKKHRLDPINYRPAGAPDEI